jgi:uridine kinase
MGKIKEVIKRTGAVVPFTPERITNAIYRAAVEVGGRDRAMAQALADQVISALEMKATPGYKPHIEEIQDEVERVLIENGHTRVAKAFILYRDERARHRKQQQLQSKGPSANIPWEKIWHILDWAISHDLHTTENLNKRIEAGEYLEIIIESEAAYQVDIEKSAQMIMDRKDMVRLVLITGPSSSGKTTSTIKIGEKLKSAGLKLVTLNVDNYFFDLEMHPKDEFGDYDFETPYALDLELINEHLKHLVAGEEVLIPFYDFKSGHRLLAQTPMKLNEGELILIDSLHGLFPALTKAIPDESKFKLYLEPLLQMKGEDGEYIRWTDIRLIRRMLRDATHRAYDPRQTLEHWHYVRSSEMRNIIPNNIHADFIINSGMPFELPIYARRMGAQFKEWERQYRDDPLRTDAYERANRVAKMLDWIFPMDEDHLVPSDSVIREFIGGSSLKY